MRHYNYSVSLVLIVNYCTGKTQIKDSKISIFQFNIIITDKHAVRHTMLFALTFCFSNGMLTGLFTPSLSCLFVSNRVALKAPRGHVWRWRCLPVSLPKPQWACQEKLCCLGFAPWSLCLSFHCLAYRWTSAFDLEQCTLCGHGSDFPFPMI